MDLPLALTALQKGGALLVFTGCGGAADRPAAEAGRRRLGDDGRRAVRDLNERRLSQRGAPPPTVDPAIQAAEVRQMLEAKSERRRQRGEAPLDVEAEAAAPARRGRAAPR